ncbi:MAG: lipopolysaccharide assembly protein LapB [Gammaproteobacteria bacterium]|nr:lipopolysaccharide assembly protein LapB [Gammaproteobacteria bacterium]
MDIWFPAIIIASLLLGWLIGRLSSSTRQSPQNNFNDCAESYIQGLNYLLANKSDKAIELFVDLIKVDNETMETHLALGNLFRSKGEVDHAIKIHQNLVARPNLDQSQRVMALTELAEDYLKAGLLDRAENLFKELVQINPKNISAQRKLFELYSLEKAWPLARTAAQVLADENEPDGKLILTHCYCEMAENALASGNLREAKEYLDKAVQIDNRCLRALLALIDVHFKTGQYQRAKKIFNQLLNSSPQFIDIYLKPARQLFLHNGSADKYEEFLLTQYHKSSSSTVALEILQSYANAEKHEQLRDFLREAVKSSPSMELFDFAFKYLQSRPESLSDLWPEISIHFQDTNNKRIAYNCSVCGYGSQNMHWNCPSCNSWSSFRPVNS